MPQRFGARNPSCEIGVAGFVWPDMQRFLFLLTICCPLLPLKAVAAPPSAKPNIVFIMADDLGWADVAFHGGNAPTPVLDKLAAEGLELTHHYSVPVCSPTRTGLMTGRCWSRFGVTTPQNERALPWDTMTLPLALKTMGYETCLTGKWHLGSKPEWGPNHFGFDHSYGSLAGGVGPWDHHYKKGPFMVTWQRDEKLIEEKGHVTDLIAKEACEWLGARKGAPFFLYVPMTAVHLPVKEPEEWVSKVPASVTGAVARQYAACIMHLDAAVGLILAALEKNGQRGNTIVVFTSDNGGSTVENNGQSYPPDGYESGSLTGNNKPLRDEKGSVYEVPHLPKVGGRHRQLATGHHRADPRISRHTAQPRGHPRPHRDRALRIAKVKPLSGRSHQVHPRRVKLRDPLQQADAQVFSRRCLQRACHHRHIVHHLFPSLQSLGPHACRRKSHDPFAKNLRRCIRRSFGDRRIIIHQADRGKQQRGGRGHLLAVRRQLAHVRLRLLSLHRCLRWRALLRSSCLPAGHPFRTLRDLLPFQVRDQRADPLLRQARADRRRLFVVQPRAEPVIAQRHRHHHVRHIVHQVRVPVAEGHLVRKRQQFIDPLALPFQIALAIVQRTHQTDAVDRLRPLTARVTIDALCGDAGGSRHSARSGDACDSCGNSSGNDATTSHSSGDAEGRLQSGGGGEETRAATPDGRDCAGGEIQGAGGE
jgi:arylsulfatase A-like enzyme